MLYSTAHVQHQPRKRPSNSVNLTRPSACNVLGSVPCVVFVNQRTDKKEKKQDFSFVFAQGAS